VRFLLELLALFFATTTIYRRLIKPFIRGMMGEKKPNGQGDARQDMKFNSSPPKKNIKTVDPKEIQDAEFEEIK